MPTTRAAGRIRRTRAALRRLRGALIGCRAAALCLAILSPLAVVASAPAGAAAAQGDQPADPPMGVPVETSSSDPRGTVLIDNQPVPGTSRKGDLIGTMISRKNRQVVEVKSVAKGPSGIGQLISMARDRSGPSNYLMVITAYSGVTLYGDVGPLLQDLVRSVGGTDQQATSVSAQFPLVSMRMTAPFSVVGVPQAQPGAAWVDVSKRPNGGFQGNMTGYLQFEVVSQRYGFVPTAVPAFSVQNLDVGNSYINYDNEPFLSQAPRNFTAGFYLLLVDPVSGQYVRRGQVDGSQSTLATNCSGCDVAQLQTQTLNLLAQAVSTPLPDSLEPPVVVLNTFGRPSIVPAAAAAWSKAADAVAGLGGNRAAFLSLNGQHTFALVGSATSPAQTAQASDVLGTGASLTGVLARGHDWLLAPADAGPVGSINIALLKTTYQSSQPWPAFTPAQQAAADWIGRAVQLCASSGPCSVRAEYYRSYDQTEWANTAGRIRDLAYPANQSFSEADFTAARTELAKEVSAVSDVKQYFTSMESPFVNSNIRERINLKAVGDAVYNDIAPPPEDETFANILDVVSKLALVGKLGGEDASNLSAGISGVFAGLSWLMKPSGQPVLPERVRVQADQLVQQYSQDLTAAADNIEQISLIDVSDYGKLMTVANNRGEPGWKLPNKPSAVIPTMDLAARRWMAQQLFPVAFPWLMVASPVPTGPDAEPLNNVYCLDIRLNPVNWWHTRLPQPPDSVMSVQAPWAVNYFFGVQNSLLWPSRPFNPAGPSFPPPQLMPKQALVKMLFDAQDPDSGALGMSRLAFISPRVFTQVKTVTVGQPLCQIK